MFEGIVEQAPFEYPHLDPMVRGVQEGIRKALERTGCNNETHERFMRIGTLSLIPGKYGAGCVCYC